MTNTVIGLGISSFFLFPGFASAELKITEIMYDVPGADTGREWVEVTNTGSQALDIGKYKLFENETNHGLKLVNGVSVLQPGASAVLASDANKFLADHVGYIGILFDTAFSLSNTGESLAIKNASSSILHEVEYTAAEESNGTQGSLQLKDTVFVAALETPGVYPGTFTSVPKAAPKQTAGKKSTSTSLPHNSKNAAAKEATISSTGNSPALPASAASLPFSVSGIWLWIAGLVGVILAGAAGILFLLSKSSETSSVADEFTIE